MLVNIKQVFYDITNLLNTLTARDVILRLSFSFLYAVDVYTRLSAKFINLVISACQINALSFTKEIFQLFSLFRPTLESVLRSGQFASHFSS